MAELLLSYLVFRVDLLVSLACRSDLEQSVHRFERDTFCFGHEEPNLEGTALAVARIWYQVAAKTNFSDLARRADRPSEEECKAWGEPTQTIDSIIIEAKK